MALLFELVAVIAGLTCMYYFAGLLFPKLPLVRTLTRARLFTFLSLITMIASVFAWDASLTPDERRELKQRREVEKRQAEQAAAQRASARMVTEKPALPEIDLQVLLAAYKNNELSADSRFKGRLIQLTGIVGDVKKDILNNAYIIVTTGSRFEVPTVQCTLARGAETRAEYLNKGERVTVRGTVMGLFWNVQMKDCQIL